MACRPEQRDSITSSAPSKPFPCLSAAMQRISTRQRQQASPRVCCLRSSNEIRGEVVYWTMRARRPALSTCSSLDDQLQGQNVR
ncbi:hypothetical protein GUITHDRAFT_156335 [Guillardia theta CCMP2712]|uniref:Uncharacterized protein n=1 Tax=Guillardia theta (strain CCMP2712) TaxID=905079 RepID=L1I9A1_GUITC|nr:hypothetical protein GUITHDRAFT_156335 [Guillardia theta CCMP2712]EKX32435.1 hypothetical protein GUITHDRAFT_156335 [Guillardia theta CCMP2712]|eukprot:XP_005819415.1 hypothetical protein GUITHDRAFT_156335 [Guillardia theta CCMP2712]